MNEPNWSAADKQLLLHWLAELNLNLLATVGLDRLLIPQMLERGKGAVVHVTSVQSVLPLPESTTGYAAAKGALRTYSKSISKELGPRGVRVNAVSPGWIMTEATGDFLEMLRAANGGTIEDAPVRAWCLGRDFDWTESRARRGGRPHRLSRRRPRRRDPRC